MTGSLPVRLARLVVLPLVLILAACDNPVRDDNHDREISRLELYADAGLTQQFAHTHGQGSGIHWDGSLPHIHPGEELAVYARFVTAGGGSISLGGEFTVRAILAEQADGVVGAPGIVSIENHGNHVDLTGVADGETHIVFLLWHGNHADWRSPPIAVDVDGH